MADERSNFWDEIKRRVDLVEYLSTHCGADFVSDGPGRVASCCPFHAEDTPSFKVSESRSGEPWKTWRCYGACGEGGTIIDAVMRQEGFAEAIEAADFLNDIYELGFERDNRRYEKFKKTKADAEAAIERAKTEMASESRVAKQAREYLRRRGLTDETIDHFGLAVDTHEAKSGRLAIPIHDRAGHAISVSHRALFDAYPCASCQTPVSAKEVAKRYYLDRKAKEKGTERVDWESCPHCGAGKTEARISWLVQQFPKYKNQEGHDKSRVLYNEPAARQALRKPESHGYFIMEGYGDVWACHQGGQLACSSYNGATISEWQAGEAAKLCLAQHPPKPIILIPDFDATGMSSVRTNIDAIRQANPQVEIQIISSLAFEDIHPKDLGELLQKKGAEAVAWVLAERRIPAEEWLIRDILDATIAKTGKPAHSKSRQMELVAEILGDVRHRLTLDHMVPLLAEKWNVGEAQARGFLNANIGGQAALPAQHLMKTITQAHVEAMEYLQEAFVIPTGFEEIDRCLPGGGARTKQLAMFLGKSGTGKTMLTTQMLANMARTGIRSIFFSLEQPAGQLYLRMVCQTLEVGMDRAMELIVGDDESLGEVDRLFENLVIVDNVPADATQMVDMTPSRIMKIIQEINLTRFSEPAQVVAIDHLGIVKVPEDAPRSVQSDDLQAAGYIMQELFAVTKITDVFMLVLQQLPKEVKAGVSFSMDAGRGGSKQTDYCDYIAQIWRPEQSSELDDEEKMAVSGQYKLALGKNRHGANTLANLYFDKATLRIIPALSIMPPSTGEGQADSVDGAPVVIGTSSGAPASADGMGDWESVEAASMEQGSGRSEADGPTTLAEVAEAAPQAPADPPEPMPVVLTGEDPGVPLDNKTLLEMLGSPAGADDGGGDLAIDYFDS